MKLFIQDTTYKLLAYNSPSGVNDEGEFRFMGTEGMAFYIFKGNEFIAHLSKVNFMDDLKKYFPSCVDLIKYLEENKVKYGNLYKYMNRFKIQSNDAFYIKPVL